MKINKSTRYSASSVPTIQIDLVDTRKLNHPVLQHKYFLPIISLFPCSLFTLVRKISIALICAVTVEQVAIGPMMRPWLLCTNRVHSRTSSCTMRPSRNRQRNSKSMPLSILYCNVFKVRTTNNVFHFVKSTLPHTIASLTSFQCIWGCCDPLVSLKCNFHVLQPIPEPPDLEYHKICSLYHSHSPFSTYHW